MDQHYNNIKVVFTKEAQTAMSILKGLPMSTRKYRITVATSDALEQHY